MPMDSAVLERLAREGERRYRTATEYVEATLRSSILSGLLPGGTALRQEDLAAAFAVSRMPVREALRQLEAQALVDFAPHKGAVVTGITGAEAADNYAIRSGLEPVALRLSLPRLTPDDLARAARLADEMDEEEDPGRMGALNRQFHLTLYGRAGRPRLLALVAQHLAAADRYLRFQLAALGRDGLSQADHRDLIAACRDKDADRAAAIVERHVVHAAAAIEGFFADRSPPAAGR